MIKCPKILVVDDDENIRRILKAILENEGYIVDLASTGHEAIQKAEQASYNLALLDIKLPDMEGIELLSLMRPVVPKTRKIMLTGCPSIENAMRALNKDADAYLVKPVKINLLLKVLKEQLILQENELEITQEKVAVFIESRLKEITSGN